MPDAQPDDPADMVAAATAGMDKARDRCHTYKFTEAERAEARDLYDRGHGHNAIARHFGWPQMKMTQLGREEGFKFAGRPTHAIEARKAQAEEDKAELKAQALRVARRLMDRLETAEYTLVYAGPRETRVEDVPVPPGFEARELTTAVRQALACVERLEEFELARETGTAEVDRFLAAMAGDDDPDGVDRAALAAEMFPGPEPEPASDEISIEDAAGRLGVLPATVRGYLRASKGRQARLQRCGGGVSARSVDDYIERRKSREAAGV